MEKFSFEDANPRKEKKDKAVSSIRGKFAKAVMAFMAPAIIAGTLGNPDKIGFSRKDVGEMLQHKQKVTEYVKNADKSAKEGEMDGKERNKLLKTVRQARYIERKIGRKNLEQYIGIAGEDRTVKEEFKDKVLWYPNIQNEQSKKVGINPKVLEAYLNSMPHVWIESIENIAFGNKYLMPASYGKNFSRGSAGASVTFDQKINKGRIDFYENEWTEHGTAYALSHELAHANDWFNRRRDMIERIDLFSRVIERVSASDRYMSGYVEIIENKDKKSELAIKAKEYWAEIVRADLMERSRLPEKDRKLVKDYLHNERKQDIPGLKLGGGTIAMPPDFNNKEY